MAFSGFGKPAGTTGGGLFGSTNTTGTTNPFGSTTGGTGTSLFGQPQQQQSAGTTGGLFGQPQQQQQQSGTTGGLFGQTQQQPQGQTTGTSLFGQTQNNTGGTGLFGQTQNTGGGLFGSTTQQPQQQQTGGLFGQQQQPQQQQQSTGTGLFGSTNTGGGLFGSTNNQQQNATGGTGLFGSTNTGGTGLFGSTNQTNTGGLGAQSIFKQPSQMSGQQSTQPQQQNQLGLSALGGNQQQVQPFTKSTKFNDLPENTRKMLESIDQAIQGQIQISKELQRRKLGEEPTKGQALIRDLHKELVEITTTIRNDAHLTQDLKEKVDQAVQDTIVATRIIDGFRYPQSGNTYLKDHASFPLEYFTRVTEQMAQRLAWYKATIEQIERKLSSSSSQGQTPQAIVTTLQTQHATFLALASKTAALDAEVQKIKAIYTQLWRSKTGSVRDPFNDNGKPAGPETGLEFSVSGLNLSTR